MICTRIYQIKLREIEKYHQLQCSVGYYFPTVILDRCQQLACQLQLARCLAKHITKLCCKMQLYIDICITNVLKGSSYIKYMLMHAYIITIASQLVVYHDYLQLAVKSQLAYIYCIYTVQLSVTLITYRGCNLCLYHSHWMLNGE